MEVIFIFFFSSRRRHTRYIGDWSSDVCSSDLTQGGGVLVSPDGGSHSSYTIGVSEGANVGAYQAQQIRTEIGRASCRERVQKWEVAGAVKEMLHAGSHGRRASTVAQLPNAKGA